MLADSLNIVQSGRLYQDIHLPSTAKLELLDFIVEELPRWRVHPDRPTADAETTLTEHLCDHLNSAVYYSTAWSHVQFRTETMMKRVEAEKLTSLLSPVLPRSSSKDGGIASLTHCFPLSARGLQRQKEKNGMSANTSPPNTAQRVASNVLNLVIMGLPIPSRP